MARANKRRDMDVMKLMMSDFEVALVHEDNLSDFYVLFEGPAETPYEGGKWKLRVQLPQDYPYKSPSIGFINTIFHPNVDERSGSVCLDVINQTWSPMFDLVNVFTMFLPQLLRYANPSDPLNGEAAALMMQAPNKYAERVKEYVRMYASDEVSLNPQGQSPATQAASDVAAAAAAAAAGAPLSGSAAHHPTQAGDAAAAAAGIEEEEELQGGGHGAPVASDAADDDGSELSDLSDLDDD